MYERNTTEALKAALRVMFERRMFNPINLEPDGRKLLETWSGTATHAENAINIMLEAIARQGHFAEVKK